MSPQHNVSSETTITEEVAIANTSVAKRTVPLQTLCQNCRMLCENWEMLDMLQSSESIPVKDMEPYHMGVVAQCLSNKLSCHLCAFFSASLKRASPLADKAEGISTLDIILQPASYEDMVTHFIAYVQSGKGAEKKMERFGEYKFRRYGLTEAGSGFLQHVTAKEIPLHAQDNLPKAKTWINTCISDHQDCRDFQTRTVAEFQGQQPTRVLEITQDTIRLRCDMADKEFDYLVLSHMWGKNHSHQVQLLRSNLERFKVEIPQAELNASSTFEEAIRLTRLLGYRYLWIDSLCIIQDSSSDWEYEARRMAIVYGNTVCNLAFLFPPGDRHGPEPRGDPRVWCPCILRHATSSRPGIYIEHDKSVWRGQFHDQESLHPWLVQRNWPLFKRAWTFQEYLLSPRTLLIGHRNLMWQCSHMFYDELLGSIADRHESTYENPKKGKDMGKSRYFPMSIHTLTTAASLSVPSVLSFMKDWQNVINEYRTRRLTYPEDRLVAFAGIARAFQNLGHLTYLAGAWKEVFPLCLLWYVDKKLAALVRKENGLPNGYLEEDTWTGEIEEPVLRYAPSWSWLSVPIYRFYQMHFLLGEDELYVRCKSYFKRPRVHFVDIFWAEVGTFRFGELTPDCFPDTAIFEFTGLQVMLEMPILPIKIDWPKELREQKQWIQDNATSDEDKDFCWVPFFEYYPDDPMGRKSPPKNAIYALLSEFQIVRPAGAYYVVRRLAGLILVPGSESGTWRRLGVWKLHLKVAGIPVDAENLASVGERWRNYPVMSSKWQTEFIVLV
ncbi:Nn.00g104850.m01.CDS01 [Neocucurbitaria sp. VM-36]